MILIYLPFVSSLSGTIEVPAFLLAIRLSICLRLASSFRERVSTVRPLACPFWFSLRLKLALFSQSSPPLVVTNEPFS